MSTHPKIIEGRLASIASKHLKGQHIDSALDHFKKHLVEEKTPEEVQGMSEDGSWPAYADSFFRGCAESAPELASESSASSGGSSASSSSKGWAISASKEDLKKAGYGW